MQSLNPKDLFADRYRLRKRLAQDGFSESWLADNEMIGSEQVLKIYNPLDDQGCKAFRREFAQAYHLAHPKLLRVTYFDVYRQRPYLVLPYFRRGTTARLAGKLGEAEVARVMRDVGGALAFIHQPAYNIVHRDVRPDNIMLDDRGHYLLSIFGIGSELQEVFYGQSGEEEADASGNAGLAPLAYQAPEYFNEEEKNSIEAASDVWSLGATLYELASGRLPFGRAGGEAQLPGVHLADLPAPFSLPLCNILRHCMEESPEARPSAQNLWQLAEDYLNTGQWPARYGGDGRRNREAGKRNRIRPPKRRIGFGMAILAGLLVVAGLLLAWPGGINFRNNQVNNERAVPGNGGPISQGLSVENSEPQETALESKEAPAPARKTAEENEGGGVLPENGQATLKTEPTVPAEPELRKPVERTITQRPAEDKNLPPKDTKAVRPPEKKQNKPEPGKEAKKPQLKPRFDKATGKWGYIDQAGTWIIWPQFEEAAPFEGGKARVAKKGKDDEVKPYYLSLAGELTPINEAEVVENKEN